MINVIKRGIIRIKYMLKEIKHNLFIEKDNYNNKKRAYIFLAADYGNLGDVAITYAQKKFLSETLKEYEIIEVPYNNTYNYEKILKKNINPSDIITIVGGGNLGNIYDEIEEKRRNIIKRFKKNKIIVFPQTFDFSDDLNGQESLRRTKKIYNGNRNLYLFAREKKSYEKMKKEFNGNVELVPDIVMSLQFEENSELRNDIVICLRNDKEKLLSQDFQQKIIDEVIEKNQKNNIKRIDTHIGNQKFYYCRRKEIFENFINEIKKAKIVITDRLHGMIFCYITKTPCIVFDNSNHKISETYETFLKEQNFIKLIKNNGMEDFEKEIEDLMKITSKNIEKIDLSFEYEKIKKVLVGDEK